jgi:hypothetical protein
MSRLSRPRAATPRIALGAVLAALLLGGCGTATGVVRGGQTEAQLAEDRRQCLPFVQAHTETSPELAEAACLGARGYRAPLPLGQGPVVIGSLYATASRDAAAMVGDFQGCRVEAFNTPMPENRDKKGSGIFTSLWEGLFPRGAFRKAQTPDEWALETFAGCLKRRGYAVSDVTPVR